VNGALNAGINAADFLKKKQNSLFNLLKNLLRRYVMVMTKKKKIIQEDFVKVCSVGNGWMVLMNNAKKMLIFTIFKREAMSVARSLAKQKKTNIVVYSKKGPIVTIKDYAA
jgi:hypothetical protein